MAGTILPVTSASPTTDPPGPGAVAVIVEERLRDAFRDPFALAVLDGLAQELDAMGTSMLLVADHGEASGNPVAGHAIDAAVFALCGRSDSPLVDHLLARRVPIIGSGAPVHETVSQVVVDEHGASAEATRHLLDLGHRRLAHVTMPLGSARPTSLVRPDELERAVYPDARERDDDERGDTDDEREPARRAELAQQVPELLEEVTLALLDTEELRQLPDHDRQREADDERQHGSSPLAHRALSGCSSTISSTDVNQATS